MVIWVAYQYVNNPFDTVSIKAASSGFCFLSLVLTVIVTTTQVPCSIRVVAT